MKIYVIIEEIEIRMMRNECTFRDLWLLIIYAYRLSKEQRNIERLRKTASVKELEDGCYWLNK